MKKQIQSLDRMIPDNRPQDQVSKLTQQLDQDISFKARVSKLTQRLDHMVPDAIGG